MDTNYPDPVYQLLLLGDVRKLKSWPDYLNLGIGKQHAPDLIAMSIDPELNQADVDSLEVWAPIHAWRTLGLLRAEEAIEPLMSLFETDDDWTGEELPEIYGLIGKGAIPALSSYLANSSHITFARITAAFSLERIGNKHPEARTDSIKALTDQLSNYKENDPELNAFLIHYLSELKAVESAQAIEQAFAADCVDEFIVGDWEDVQIELGLKEARINPPSYGPFFYNPLSDKSLAIEYGETLKDSTGNAARKKAGKKRKMAKLSRKKNRKRH